uniref:Cytochrome b561 n=1 Tax=Timema douglasi TaxID=61478 RepID=A0A7R8VVE4_TIMDO|nr:unnamed protein product [Timema douglasi]
MESPPETNLKGFSIAFGTTEFLGALAVVMMTVWVGHYRGGYSWSSLEPDLEFNWHPVLMTVSLIFLYGNYYWDMAMAMGASKRQAGPAARLYLRYPNKRHPSVTVFCQLELHCQETSQIGPAQY